jgi:hypothetical protein
MCRAASTTAAGLPLKAASTQIGKYPFSKHNLHILNQLTTSINLLQAFFILE